MTTPEEIPAEQPAPEAIPAPVVEPDQPTGDEEEMKAFVTELVKQAQLGYDPAQLRKAIVVSSESTASPPTCTVQFPNADGTVGESIPGVRYFDHYTPVAGDTTVVAKQGADIVALGQINNGAQGGSAQGWATAASSVQYRKVVDNGDFKVQFKGIWSGSGTTLFTLPSGSRPSTTRVIVCGRSGDAAAVKVQISTSGTVSLIGATDIPNTNSATPGATGSTADHTHTNPNTSTSSGANTGSVGGHTHTNPSTGSTGGSTDSHNYGTITDNAHTHSGGSHTHTLSSHTHVAHLDHVHSHGGAVAETSFGETESTSGPSSNTSGSSGSGTGGTAVTIAVGSHSHGVNSHSHATGDTGSSGGHSHTTGDHAHSQGSTGANGAHAHASASHAHSVTLALPGTVYFDGKEFFI